MKRLAVLVTSGVALGAVLLGVSTIAPSSPQSTVAAPPPVLATPAAFVTTPSATLDELITQLSSRVETYPQDDRAWATLGLAYVQQARVKANGDLYPLAEEALNTSLEVNDVDNFLAYAGLAALSSARHDFTPAREFALKGIAINDFSPILHGALADAAIQLGLYDEAFTAMQRMVDLSPDTASLTRASYAWELRGDTEQATALMQRALDDAPTPADRSFALLHLGDLAYNSGDPDRALELYNAALVAQPDSAGALGGKARAEAASGQVETAIDHYEELVARGLEPFYILQYAQLLESLGRTAEADAQYAEYETQESVHAAREVQPDATFILFFADHGKPEQALELAERALSNGAFLDTWDAYAWSLHANGRHAEAWDAMEEALELGSRNALFEYHAGVIRLALDDVDGARSHLTRALEINPNFNFVAAQAAQETLDNLSAT